MTGQSFVTVFGDSATPSTTHFQCIINLSSSGVAVAIHQNDVERIHVAIDRLLLITYYPNHHNTLGIYSI